MKFMVLLFFVLAVGCAKNNIKVNESYQMEKPYTYPEERNVLQAVPVIPVHIEIL
tara:strand:- start:306 stop:470 length:165 start_codon:yes stop_codon:yes gene_type:complete